MSERKHEDALAELLALPGAQVLDVGCGNGRITRLVAALGATVIGIDPGEKQLAKARAEPAVAGERYIKGVAEDLPAADASADGVLFFNSLHHVPVDKMDAALAEARRVLKPEGWVCIAEPMAEGPQYELAKPFNDEAEVRAEAYAALKRASGFRHISESSYTADGRHTNFEEYRDSSTAIDPSRTQVFAQREAEIRARFERYGEKRADGWHFPQPMRVNLLRKA